MSHFLGLISGQKQASAWRASLVESGIGKKLKAKSAATKIGASFAEVESSPLVCFWGAAVPVYWLAGCLLAGVGLQRHGLVGFSGMDNVGKGAIQRLQSVLPSTTKQSNEALPCARSQPTRTTRPQPAQAGP